MSETANLIVAATIACAGQTSGQRRLLRGKIESVESLEAAVRSAYGFGDAASLCFSVQKPNLSKTNSHSQKLTAIYNVCYVCLYFLLQFAF